MHHGMISLAAVAGALASATVWSSEFTPVTEVLSDGWEFSRGGTGAWERVSVPHDWAIAGPFDFASDPDKNGNTGNTGALPWRGVGVYRRTLEIPADWTNAVAALEFDGVMSRPEVFLDGVKVGGWNYGYMGFRVELANRAKPGAKHELVVRCDTTRQVSRWYPGAGIYREVRLVADDARNRALPGSVFISTPSLTRERALVLVEWETPLGPGSKTFEISNPRLWDVDDPYLYELELFGRRYRYGVRKTEWREDGLHLNGRRVKIHGANLHSDLGPLGMAFDRSAARRQLEIMKDMGANAFRTSHNPPDPRMLDLCDELGILVWDECFDKWEETAGRTPEENLEGYVMANLDALVRRDRNHPSVIVWSLGNEIPPAWNDNWYCGPGPDGTMRERVATFAALVRALDPTRPVAMGCCYTESVGLGHLGDLDLTGWNYRATYRCMRRKYPTKPVLYSESSASMSSAGVFDPQLPTNRYDYAKDVLALTSYDYSATDWSDIADVDLAREEEDKYLAGQFVWSGIDYLGEPCANWFRNRSSQFGICDLVGLPKDRYYLYRSVWNKKSETVHLLPHWTWPGREGKNVPVFCYASGDRAELFVNGKSMGVRRKGERQEDGYYGVTDDYRFRWLEVPYEPGEIKVVAYRGDEEIGTDVVRTAGAPAKVALDLEDRDRSAGALRFVRVTVTDAAGVSIPAAGDRIRFSIAGGEIVAVGNGCPWSTESFKDVSAHSLFNGTALLYVRKASGGKAKLVAEADGLAKAELEF